MLGESHPHRPRVVALLEEAGRSMLSTVWDSREARPIGLELVVVAPSQAPASDATNYLGGVADVLQANRVNAALAHLGETATTTLYADDRQIREVRYSVEEGATPRYYVRVWVL